MMKRLLYLLVTFSFMIVPGQSLARINMPVMWSQLPDMNNENAYLSTLEWDTEEPTSPIVAIDFMVSSDPELYKPIVALRWWGCYLDGFEPDTPRENAEFVVSWYFDKIGEPWTPGDFLYNDFSVFASETFFGMAGTMKIYEYNAYLSLPFDQEYWQGEQPYGWWWFWIGIAFKDTSAHGRQWGWHASLPTDNIVANVGETQTGPWTYLDDDVALEMMVITALETMSCFEVNTMMATDETIQGAEGDKIEMKGTFDLSQDAQPFDPETDTVALAIDQEQITIPPESFVVAETPNQYQFIGYLPGAGMVTMYLNFDRCLWETTIYGKEAGNLYESDGAEVALTIGVNMGKDEVIWTKKKLKPVARIAKFAETPPIHCCNVDDGGMFGNADRSQAGRE
ncbi:MAG: hypothetical protein JRF37_02590 [Deltaproteobacteria bacterium]|nr:hypothetical protein [Deltaproteobacteria bacterium]